MGETERGALGEGVAAGVVRAGVGSLEAALGPGVFLKLRSHCNAAPEFLVGSVAGARAVVLLRRAQEWALSRHRAFGEPADMVAQILRDALVGVDRLRRAGMAPAIVWFEELVGAPEAVVSRLLGRAVGREVLAGVMGEDSQAGTGIERAVVRERAVEAGFLAAFAAEWAERRPSGRLGERLADLLDVL